MVDWPRCWCGSADLARFSPDYLACAGCGTLVAASMPAGDIGRVDDEEHDFYGRRYWFDYQERELGTPDITVRARTDLPERCIAWLRTVLRYQPPPARVLDLGCGHGGFVMLLARAGFEATGLELSPWVVDFARKTFGVSVCRGSLEDQALGAGSLDVVTMMDVLEHLPEPQATLRAVVAALGEHGIVVIQTPAVPPGLSWEAMVAQHHPFLPLMRERGHLYLFSESGLQRLLADVGFTQAIFEPAYFAAYDMLAVARCGPLTKADPASIAEALASTPDSRLVRALLDLDDRRGDLQVRYVEAERDRAARLAALHDHGARLMATEGQSHVLRSELEHLRARLAGLEADRAVYVSVISERGARLAASEADRAARLVVIQDQGARLGGLEAQIAQLRAQLDAVEAERATALAVVQEHGTRLSDLQTELTGLRAQLNASEADRAARLAIIGEQARRLAASEQERAARLRVIQEQADRLQSLGAERAALEARFRRRGGRLGRVTRSILTGLGSRTGLIAPEGVTRPAPAPGGGGPAGAPPGLPPPAPVTVHEALDVYVRSIDALTAVRSDLAPVRVYNHAMLDALDAASPLAGRTLLDIGASPHGFALEHALRKGVAVYLGVGLGVWEPTEVHSGSAVGRLVAGYGETLALAPESIDLALSLSTFEHFPDGGAVLREIYRVLRPGGRFFVNFQPVWTSSGGHHLHHLESVARLIPPWAHLLWNPATMREALADRWPVDAPISLGEAVAWVYESREINRVDVATLRRMFETAPFTIEWITPLPDDDGHDKPHLAAYLATVLPYSAADLLTRGFSIMMRKA